MIHRQEYIRSGTVRSLNVEEELKYQGIPFVPSAATDEKAKVSANDTTAAYLEDKFVAGANVTLTVNNDGANETITIAASADNDEKAKVSANDTTAGYLNGKLVAGSGVTLTENNNGGNETLTIATTVTNTDETAKVSSNDTTSGYLNGKLVAGANITLTENNNGGNETLTIATTVTNTDETAKVSSNDTTAGYLNGKLVAGTGITLTENNNGGNETLTIAASGGGGGSSDITYYTASLADCENTTSKTNLISATIPANTWADGDQVTLKIAGDLTTNSASSSLTMGVEGTGFGPYTRSANVNVSSDPNRFTTEFRFMRNGAGLYYYVGGSGTWSESPYLDIGLATLLIGSFGGINSVSDDWLIFDSSVDFTTNITLAITSQWGTAGAGIWIRPFWGNAYKEKGTAL